MVLSFQSLSFSPSCFATHSNRSAMIVGWFSVQLLHNSTNVSAVIFIFLGILDDMSDLRGNND